MLLKLSLQSRFLKIIVFSSSVAPLVYKMITINKANQEDLVKAEQSVEEYKKQALEAEEKFKKVQSIMAKQITTHIKCQFFFEVLGDQPPNQFGC